MTTFYRTQGDVTDTIVNRLLGIDSLITATAVVGHVSFGGAAAATLTGAVSDAVACEVTLQCGTWLLTATPGEWDLETQVTFGDGSVKTWPGKGTDSIVVREQIS